MNAEGRASEVERDESRAGSGSPNGCGSGRATRWEWASVAVWTVLALGLRLVHPDGLCIEHWDEAVYANNHHARLLLGGPYPAVYLYAPPLVPALIEGSLGLFGATSAMAIMPVLVLGTLVVPLAWWTARAWFGPAAGFAAAGLVATSGYHIAFSRMALTDAPLATFFLAALGLGRAAIARDSWGWSAGAGLACGLAWATKYNGWLAPAAIVAGYAAWAAFEPSARRRAVQAIPRVALLVAVACACWWPILQGLEAKGGYAAVAQNHARYFVGLGGAWDAFARQAAHHRHLNGGASVLGWFAFAAPLPLAGGRARLFALGLLAVAWWWGSSAATGLAAAMGLGWALIAGRCRQAAAPDAAARLAAWIAAAAFVGLSLVTPLYTPYPRISLLWIVLATIPASGLAGALAAGPGGVEPAWIGRRGAWPTAIALGLALIAATLAVDRSSSPAWQDRSGRRVATLAAARAALDFTRRVLHHAPARRDVTFVVFGAPDAFFHLAGEGYGTVPVVRLERLAAGRAHLPRSAFLLARENADFAEQAAALAGAVERIASFDAFPSDHVMLDDHAPAELGGPNARLGERLTLYWLR